MESPCQPIHLSPIYPPLLQNLHRHSRGLLLSHVARRIFPLLYLLVIPTPHLSRQSQSELSCNTNLLLAEPLYRQSVRAQRSLQVRVPSRLRNLPVPQGPARTCTATPPLRLMAPPQSRPPPPPVPGPRRQRRLRLAPNNTLHDPQPRTLETKPYAGHVRRQMRLSLRIL